MGICCMSQETQAGALYQSRGVGWGGRFKTKGIYVYIWLIHVEVWQKIGKFYKTIILQLKNKLISKMYLKCTHGLKNNIKAK